MINRSQVNFQNQQSFGMKYKGLNKNKTLNQILPNIDQNPIKTIFEKSNLVKEIDAKYPNATARILEILPEEVCPMLGSSVPKNVGLVGMEIKLRRGAQITLDAFSNKVKQQSDFHHLYKEFEETVNNTRLTDLETKINRNNAMINLGRNPIVKALRHLFGFDKKL